MKLAGVYQFRDRLIVTVHHQTVDNHWKQRDAFLVAEPTNPVSVGSVVREALEAVRYNIPRPTYDSLQSRTYPALEASGVKSHATFMKSARHVDVEQNATTLTIRPFANQGARGGFQSIEDKAQSLTAPDDAALGAAVLAAFADTV